MRGIKNFNFPAFHEWAILLRDQGHIVFSPAEKDIERHGADISAGNWSGDERLASAQHGFDLRIAFAEDLEYICHHAEAVALLPGWQNSKGATAERAVAEALGLGISYLGVSL